MHFYFIFAFTLSRWALVWFSFFQFNFQGRKMGNFLGLILRIFPHTCITHMASACSSNIPTYCELRAVASLENKLTVVDFVTTVERGTRFNPCHAAGEHSRPLKIRCIAAGDGGRLQSPIIIIQIKYFFLTPNNR